ncbi:MAG: hypothetical protein CR984_02330, partial [Proteobacteria bacterium]
MIRNNPKKTMLHRTALIRSLRWAMLALVLAVFTICLYPEIVVEKQAYTIGDVVSSDIKATDDFFIEDQAATMDHQRQAIDDVPTVYDLNPKILKSTVTRLTDAFKLMRHTYKTEIDKLRTQDRSPHLLMADGMHMDPVDIPDLPTVSLEERMLARKNEFENRVGTQISKGAFAVLTKHAFSEEISKLLTTIVTQVLSTGVVANKEILLKESTRGITLRNVETLSETRVLNLKQFYGPDQAKAMVRIVGNPLLKGADYALLNLIVDLSQRLIQPNVTLNSHETETRREAAAQKIKPVLYMIKKGEMLLREGERVTPLQLHKLEVMEGQADTHRVPLVG